MTSDDELEARLTRYQIRLPSAGLDARTRRRLARRADLRDFVGGWCVAVAAIFVAVAFASAVPDRNERLNEALSDPVRGPEVAFAIEAMGGTAEAVDYVLFVLPPAPASSGSFRFTIGGDPEEPAP